MTRMYYVLKYLRRTWMAKRVVFMTVMDGAPDVLDYKEWCFKTWQWWCKKNDVELFVLDQELRDKTIMKPTWQRWHVFEVLEANGIECDQVALVDIDTMIRWDAPNIFDLYHDEFCGVVDNINLKWIHDSINVYKKFFPDIIMDISSYFNAGVLFFSNKHLDVFEDILNFYMDNQHELDNWKLGGGKEQTILNYHLIKHNVRKKELIPEWNLLGMHRRDLFGYNWQLNEDKTPFFIKYGYVWHFTGFPVKDRIDIMKQVWEIFGNKYD